MNRILEWLTLVDSALYCFRSMLNRHRAQQRMKI